MERAANTQKAIWTIAGFNEAICMPEDALVASVGRRDWGVITGPIASIPSIVRKSYLNELIRCLEKSAASSIGTPPVASITGLSGIGKSSIAATYIGRCAHLYDRVFWIEASSDESLFSSFQRVADSIGLTPSYAESLQPQILHHLENSSYRWLLVFDDAVDVDSVSQWMPRVGNGAIISTSIDRVAFHQGCHIHVGKLLRRESVTLLSQRLCLKGKKKVVARALNHLAEVLEDWPLALEVAAAYVKSCQIRIVDISSYAASIKSASLNDEGYAKPFAKLKK